MVGKKGAKETWAAKSLQKKCGEATAEIGPTQQARVALSKRNTSQRTSISFIPQTCSSHLANSPPPRVSLERDRHLLLHGTRVVDVAGDVEELGARVARTAEAGEPGAAATADGLPEAGRTGYGRE